MVFQLFLLRQYLAPPIMSQVGIQQLLQAEQRAQEKIAAARKEKTILMKQAKDEADRDIAEYRAQREAQYQEHSKKHMGSTDEYTKSLGRDTALQIDGITKMARDNQDKVISLLLDSVTQVNF
eukprot:TRINITY_DN738_c0_g1_i1.p1 TRINITY_DN738_c0_g1~~TRINITY_DN738_c0_g1_i1.p1  ORF type:complete len:123 (+),score=37.19 TRINITY_DN738_c0_g1_i1:3-371(+)